MIGTGDYDKSGSGERRNQEPVFTNPNLRGEQTFILEYIRGGELEEALRVLDGMLPENNPVREAERLLIQKEGYRACSFV